MESIGRNTHSRIHLYAFDPKVATKIKRIELPANMKSNLDEPCMDEPSDIKDHSSRESIPSQMVSQ